MTKLHLSADNAVSRSALHSTFAKVFSFPQWYGRNLDALYDCLTDTHEDAVITLDEDSLIASLGDRYVTQLKRVLTGAAESNPHIVFE